METEFIVKVSSAKMPSNCFGRYQHIALIEVEKGTYPKMISYRAKGVIRIHRIWRNRFLGTTKNCAANRVKRRAQEIADELNAERGLKK